MGAAKALEQRLRLIRLHLHLRVQQVDDQQRGEELHLLVLRGPLLPARRRRVEQRREVPHLHLGHHLSDVRLAYKIKREELGRPGGDRGSFGGDCAGLPAHEMAYSAAHALSCSCLDAALERSFSLSLRCAATQSSSSFEGWCSRAIEYMQDAACSAAVPLSSMICSSMRKTPASMSPLLYSGVALKARNLSARAAASFSSRLPSPNCAR
mmetsp:Transcript_8227/g.27146  ORF Transcript_8227/g.27146 Transcript_8227/m.27146 type:complete len:210 (+) Transcript_8227:518-1147(+)